MAAALLMVLAACGQPFHEHTYGDWVTGPEGHYRPCTCGCPSSQEYRTHTDADHNALCDVCGYALGNPIASEDGTGSSESNSEDGSGHDTEDTGVSPTGTYKLDIVDDGNHIINKPTEANSYYAPGTLLEFYANPIMDADLVMYVNNELWKIQTAEKRDDEYVWVFSYVMPDHDVVIQFSVSTVSGAAPTALAES